jgi:hypothetical protein
MIRRRRDAHGLTAAEISITIGNVNLGGRAFEWGAAVGAAIALGSACLVCAPAQGATEASLTASLSHGRSRAHTTLTLTVHLAGSAGAVPPPLSRAVLRLPAGLGLEIPRLRSCSAALLIARGVHGCPAQSLIGEGYALVEGELGAKTLEAPVELHAFLGPPHNLQPTFEILSEGTSPISTQVLFTASAQPAAPPYGEELVMSVPPVSAAPDEPNLSLLTFSLTIGGRATDRAATVRLPSRCPTGGLPFAAEFTYADGSTGSARTAARCPA